MKRESDMHFVGILGKASASRWKIKQRLESRSTVQVEEFSCVKDLLCAVKQGRLSIIAVKVNKFEQSHIKTLKNLRNILPCISILLIADIIPEALRLEFANLQIPAVGILELTHESDDLGQLIEKLGYSDTKVTRRHRRFDTHTPIGVFTASGAGGAGTLLNVSAGGACVRFHGRPIPKGDAISIRILDNKTNDYVIQGKVVWAQDDAHLLGVQFSDVRTNFGEIIPGCSADAA